MTIICIIPIQLWPNAVEPKLLFNCIYQIYFYPTLLLHVMVIYHKVDETRLERQEGGDGSREGSKKLEQDFFIAWLIIDEYTPSLT